MKKDILNKEDIKNIICLFYSKVKEDKSIGYFFSEVMSTDWDSHLKRMCLFWENVLFYTGEYEGDPLNTHRDIYKKSPTTPEHFKQWLNLFEQSVDALHSGPNADKIKSHAKGISTIMQLKIQPPD